MSEFARYINLIEKNVVSAFSDSQLTVHADKLQLVMDDFYVNLGRLLCGNLALWSPRQYSHLTIKVTLRETRLFPNTVRCRQVVPLIQPPCYLGHFEPVPRLTGLVSSTVISLLNISQDRYFPINGFHFPYPNSRS